VIDYRASDLLYPAMSQPLFPHLRVLAVDDDAFQLKLLSQQLGRLGVTDITTRLNASEAAELVRADTNRFNLVFSDLQMPGMDGVELVRHLGQHGYRGCVAVLSGEDVRILQTVERLAHGHALRFLGTLRKPANTEQLRAVLQAASGDAPVAAAPTAAAKPG
jgi:CheY-like chemotaxis protein